jgi:O-antigen ligase
MVSKDKFNLCFFLIGFLVLFPLFVRLPAIAVPMPIGAIFVLASSVLIVIFSAFSKKKLLFPRNWVVLTACYVMAVFIPLLIGVEDSALPNRSIMAALQMIMPIGAFYVFFYLLDSREKYTSLILGGFAGVFLFSVIVLLSKNNVFLPGTFEVVHPVLTGPFEFYQFRQYVGIVMASGMLLGSFLLKSTFNNLILIIFALAIVLAISEMFTSAGTIMSLVSFGLIALRFLGLSKLIFISPIFFASLLFMGFGDALQEAVTYELSNIAYAGNRFGVWSESLEIIKASPILGNSFSFESVYADRMLGSHSQLLNIWSRAGIFPLLIWMGILFYAIYRSYSLMLLGSNSVYYFGYRGLFVAIIQLAFLSSIVVTSFDQPYSGTVIWLLISLVERGYQFERNKGIIGQKFTST